VQINFLRGLALRSRLSLGDLGQPLTDGTCVARHRPLHGCHPGGNINPPAPVRLGVNTTSYLTLAIGGAAGEGKRECAEVVREGSAAGFCECGGGAVAGVTTCQWRREASATSIDPELLFTCSEKCITLYKYQKQLLLKKGGGY